jgi:hypothetical protein
MDSAVHGTPLVVKGVVAGPRAERSLVPGDARVDRVRRRAEAEEEGNAAAPGGGTPPQKSQDWLLASGGDGVSHECGPREGIASYGAHPIPSSRDGVKPGRRCGTRSGRDRRGLRLL